MVGKLYERLEALAGAGPRHAPADQLLALRKMLEQALRQRQHKRQQPWANLSQALRQVGAERRLPAELRQALHALRLTANRVLHENYAATPADVLAGFEALAALLGSLSGVHYNGPRPPVPAQDVAPAADHGTPQPTPWAGPTWFVHTLSVEAATGLLLVEAETPGAGGAPSEAFWLRLPEAFAALRDAAQTLRPALLLHGPHQLLPEAGPAGGRPVYQPARVVLEPDYLISVTTVAECVDWKRDLPAWAIQKAFQPDQPSRALLFGNLVNQVLDEEISREDFEFADFVSSRLFRTNALSLSALVEVQTTEGLRTLLHDLRQHHATLRQTKRAGFVATSHSGFQQQPLRPADCFLEPSFLSATYGLQGRLDLLHESADGYDLIELKSTKAVPDKLPWTNHQAQAQLYRLLLSSTTGEGEPARGRTSILYSAAGSGAAAVKPVLRDEELIDRLLMIRNELVARELQLAQASGPAQVAELLRPVLQPDVDVLPKFSQDKAREVADAWARADATERAYCLELVRFAARELRLTMLGADARPGDVGGQAGLWRSSDARKIQGFALLDGLTLLEDHSETGYLDASGESLGPCLVFERALDGPPVNFRAGDTLLLYPRRHRQRPERLLGPLECQVAKVTLALDLGADGRVVVGLRATRLGARYLASHSHWALEPDTYDSYRREWAGLSAFLSLPAERRQRLLARTAPRRPADWQPGAPPATAAAEVVRRALAAPDWFVLCGPPGTGKTRSVLRELAVQLCLGDQHTLLAAYTNRAVDEICEQLVEAGLPFIRVGSRLGTAPAYRRYLLEHMISDCPTRASVKARLAGTPFYVGTVAGLLGKPELFALKKFDLAVVDEASQVLESPMLALLARVPKFILIGDHRQLPAVVAQEPTDSAVAPEVAGLLRQELGMSNLRNSYFERLFRRAEAHWPHAHGTLANHYRMHADLVALVNDDFYQGQLHCPEPWQHQPLSRPAWPQPAGDAFLARVRDERLIFISTRRQPADRSLKESSQEAELAARAAAFVAQGYGPAFDPEKSLGIIASYRNQAARIRTRLAQLADELALPALTQVSVDTVERYQGSQREVIIVSFCCHQEHQLETMVSPDETGTVDRKLNVALTRARQQLILLGNEEILRHAPHHAALLRRCGV